MIYKITTGTLTTEAGEPILSGMYAGGDHGTCPEAVNNPAYCAVHMTGPLPIGFYDIGEFQPHCAAVSSPAFALTPMVQAVNPLTLLPVGLPLGKCFTPIWDGQYKNAFIHNTFGRGGFFMHYNNPHRDAAMAPYPPPAGRNSSDGCPVATHPGDLDIVNRHWLAGDKRLQVIA